MHASAQIGFCFGGEHGKNEQKICFCEAAPPLFGAGALDVSGLIRGKAGTLSPYWALRKYLKILGSRFARLLLGT